MSVYQHLELNSERNHILEYVKKVIEHDERYIRMIIDGFFQRKMKSDANIDFHTSLSQSKNRNTSSHFAGYLNAIMDQEIPSTYLQHKRQVDHGLEPTTDRYCKVCHAIVEDYFK